MTIPTSVQRIKRSHVVHGSDNICITQKKAPSDGMSHTNGTLKGRFNSGCVLRNTITEIHTIANAIKVPIETSSLNTLRGKIPAIAPVAIPAKIVAFCGTPRFALTLENNDGSNPSFEIA